MTNTNNNNNNNSSSNTNSNYWVGGTSYNNNSSSSSVKKVSSVRSLVGTKDGLFQRRHYEFLAKAIGEFDLHCLLGPYTLNQQKLLALMENKDMRNHLTDYMIKHFSDLLEHDNPRFDAKRFKAKVNEIKESKWPSLYG